MTDSLNSIPNSSVVWSLLSSCYRFIGNAAPAPSQIATSLIDTKSQEGGSLSSRVSPIVLVIGAAAVLSIAYVIWKIVIPRLFSPSNNPPSPPSDDLAKRTTVIPAQVNGSGLPPQAPPANQDNGGGLPPQVPSVNQVNGADLPPPASPANQDNGGGLPSQVLPVIQVNGAADLQPPAPPANQVNEGGLPPQALPVIQVNGADLPPPASPANQDNGGGLPSQILPVIQVNGSGLPPQAPPANQVNGRGLPSQVLPVADLGEKGKEEADQPLSSVKSRTSSIEEDLRPNLDTHTHAQEEMELVLPNGKQVDDLHQPSSSSSPYSSPDLNSGSGSENDGDNDLSSAPMVQTANKLTAIIDTKRHFTKWTKYRLIQDQLEQFARKKKIQSYTSAEGESKAASEIGQAWNDLVSTLYGATTFTKADAQYKKTVKCLRVIIQLSLAIEKKDQEEIERTFSTQLQTARELCYIRFAGIEIFPYCRELIELGSGKPLPANLTLDNFLEELLDRVTALNRPVQELRMNPVSHRLGQAKGTFGVGFDPLIGSNIPYVNGRLTLNGKSIVVLRHGVPVEHDDPVGLAFDVLAAPFRFASSMIPDAIINSNFVNYIVPKRETFGALPTINADFVGFILEAQRQGKYILSVIVENGQQAEGATSKETPRVKVRLQIGGHDNCFTFVLRLDGEFFERHGLLEQVELLQHLKDRFKGQLLRPLIEIEGDMSASYIATTQAEDQLNANGFCIPPKLRNASKLDDHIDDLLREIQTLYFPNVENITTLRQHQAFLLLSYAHIILFICWKLNISILEILCKDDKDRGIVMKTILTLHFLYITGQAGNTESLNAVLVNMLAPAFIMQKNAMIPSRVKLLDGTIPFITAAYTREHFPKTMVFGVPIEQAAYEVVKPQGQTIRPLKATSRTLEEYQAFLNEHKPLPSVCGRNLIDEMAQEFYPDGERQDEKIQQIVSTTARNMRVFIGNDRVEALHNLAYEHNLILVYLLPLGDDDWKVSCSIQEKLGERLLAHLEEIFAHRPMDIFVSLVEESPTIRLTEEDKIARIEFDATYTIADRKGALAKVKASLTIPNHRTGHTHIEYSFVKD